MSYRCQLRPFAPEDFDSAYALWSVTEGVGLNESDTPGAIAAFLARNPGSSQVALAPDGSLIGAVLCGHDGRRGYLHHLAVARAFRRQGIGRALVEACLAALRAQGIPKCNLFLYAHNTEGDRFWSRLGWAARGDLVIVQRRV